mgnify:CR=1 FL=1
MLWLLTAKVVLAVGIYALTSGALSLAGQQPLSWFPGWTQAPAGVVGKIRARSFKAETLRHTDHGSAFIAPVRGGQWRVVVPSRRFETVIAGDKDQAISAAVTRAQG